ncbi:MAG: DNA gyrase inhibitor YacG [Boseongicola sp.]|nr:DNA gyrase inhibitor YacG [Boseongicola sp.]MYH58217.1 DNA gyrase inhibitor YacG [Boseongicola sp. SB0675_bin_26]
MSCPICQKPAKEGYAPFCSKRCADLDLWRWLNGAYSVPCDDDLPEESEGSGLPSEDGETRH